MVSPRFIHTGGLPGWPTPPRHDHVARLQRQALGEHDDGFGNGKQHVAHVRVPHPARGAEVVRISGKDVIRIYGTDNLLGGLGKPHFLP